MFNSKHNRKIDFIVGGVQKSGTSALNKYLRLHPDIGMPTKKKELHFFYNEKIFSKKINYSSYTKSFDFSSNKKIYGEVTPIYIFWENSCKRIWEYNKDIKLIFILRNPIERAFSQWNMQVDQNREKESFSYCIRNENERIKASLPVQLKRFSYVNRGFYSEQIRRYKRFFNEEQMFFVKYDYFKNKQEESLRSILNFLGVDENKFEFQHKTTHQRKKHGVISLEDKNFLIDKFYFDIKQVEKELGWDCSDWLQ